MTARIGVLVVHGMGMQPPSFAAAFVAEMDRRLEKLGVLPGEIAWEAGYWANILNAAEDTLWINMRRGGPLDLRFIRRFVLNALADAVAYRRGEAGSVSIYDEIHERILDHIQTLRASLGEEDKPLVVLAHSLGSVIMSDYIWNAQTNNRWSKGRNPFECMQTLTGFVTFGSNIPLFSLALPEIEAIRFPPATLPPRLSAVAKWLNFYDRDDVLGWPLKTLSPSYDVSVAEDREINVGGLITSWNPASHTEYWTDNNFTKPVADFLASVVKAARD